MNRDSTADVTRSFVRVAGPVASCSVPTSLALPFLGQLAVPPLPVGPAQTDTRR